MIIQVSDSAIGERGQKPAGATTDCMVARAFKEAGFKDVKVYISSADIDGHSYKLPQEVVEKINQWCAFADDPNPEGNKDRPRPEPFEFELDIPAPQVV